MKKNKKVKGKVSNKEVNKIYEEYKHTKYNDTSVYWRYYPNTVDLFCDSFLDGDVGVVACIAGFIVAAGIEVTLAGSGGEYFLSKIFPNLGFGGLLYVSMALAAVIPFLIYVVGYVVGYPLVYKLACKIYDYFKVQRREKKIIKIMLKALKGYELSEKEKHTFEKLQQKVPHGARAWYNRNQGIIAFMFRQVMTKDRDGKLVDFLYLRHSKKLPILWSDYSWTESVFDCEYNYCRQPGCFVTEVILKSQTTSTKNPEESQEDKNEEIKETEKVLYNCQDCPKHIDSYCVTKAELLANLDKFRGMTR